MTFEEACDHLFKVEGFYSNSKADLGGATKFGITLYSWAVYTKKEVTSKDVMMITPQMAKDFYLATYWIPLRCDLIKSETLKYIIFDQAINRGTPTVVRQMQKILGLKVDGIFGDNTLSALNAQDEGFSLRFAFDCQDSYCQLVQRNPSQLVFLSGWINRTQELIKIILGG